MPETRNPYIYAPQDPLYIQNLDVSRGGFMRKFLAVPFALVLSIVSCYMNPRSFREII